jgi:SAM-dependent methyltransferase
VPVIERLPRIVPAVPDRERIGGADHPMRAITRAAAFEPDSWDRDRAESIRSMFDGLAPSWNERFVSAAEHDAPVADALARGAVARGGRALEVGSGTGLATAALVEQFDCVVALDLSLEMLRQAPAALAPRVQADAARLPFADARFDAVVLVNAILFPDATARAVAPGGVVVWVSSVGDDTPIYLPPADVVAALPGVWEGVWSEAGTASWAVLRRARQPTP